MKPASLLLLLACAMTAQDAARPNFILILADDLGSAELGCTGSQRIRTPHIDALRQRGVLFTQAYAGAPVCAPSRCVLLTGRDSPHAQIRDNGELPNPGTGRYGGQRGLAADTPTIASLLRKAGYATGCFGKWGLGGAHPEAKSGHPLKQGFDRFFGYLCQRHAHSYWPEYLDSDFEQITCEGNTEKDGKVWAPDRITEEALAWMRKVHKKPFFLYFPSIIPHLALQAPAELVDRIPPIDGDTPYDGKAYRACARPRATYTAMVQRLDEHVGQLVAEAGKLGVLHNTVFLFMSDNGAAWDLGGYDPQYFRGNGKLRGHKGDVFEGGLRIPLIIATGNEAAAGTTCDTPVSHTDLLPTLCALANTKAAPGEGISLAEALRKDGKLPARESMVWEFPQGNGAQAVRLGNWKGVRQGGKKNADARIALFDLSSDPGEKQNVADQHPEIIERMVKLLGERTPAIIPAWEFPPLKQP